MFISINCKCRTIFLIGYEYGIDNDMVFNSIQPVCCVQPKAYKLYLPTVIEDLQLHKNTSILCSIGSEALNTSRNLNT